MQTIKSGINKAAGKVIGKEEGRQTNTAMEYTK
jgi:hypothetical protein